MEEIFIQLASAPNKDYQEVGSTEGHSNKVNPEEDENDEISQNQIETSQPSSLPQSFEKLEGFSLYAQQFRGIFVKRVFVSMRDWKSAISQLFLPVVFILMALSFTLIVPSYADYPVLELTPWIYENVNSFSGLENDNPEFKALNDALNNKPGWGTLCLSNYTPSTWTYSSLKK